MKFKMSHVNHNVFDLNASLTFYEQALGLTEKRRKSADDGSYILAFIGNDEADFQLELTWLRDWEKPYELGDNEFHLGFHTDDFEKAHKLHEEMGCICFENKKLGIYFIEDPDGYWLEILPAKR
jgi:lactoylglutathione lyase